MVDQVLCCIIPINHYCDVKGEGLKEIPSSFDTRHIDCSINLSFWEAYAFVEHIICDAKLVSSKQQTQCTWRGVGPFEVESFFFSHFVS
jgi:hypothetical protein